MKNYNYIWRIYYTLVKLVDPLLTRALRLQASRRPASRRVRVLVYSRVGDQVLLVKNVVGSKNWTLPGGGVEAGETDQRAACRELEEELGLKLDPKELLHLYTAQPGSKNSGVRQLAPIFLVVIDKNSLDISNYRKIEIMEVIWAKVDDLPPNCSLLTRTTVSRLPEFTSIGKIGNSLSESEQAGYEKII